jgi:hypothetical protein
MGLLVLCGHCKRMVIITQPGKMKTNFNSSNEYLWKGSAYEEGMMRYTIAVFEINLVAGVVQGWLSGQPRKFGVGKLSGKSIESRTSWSSPRRKIGVPMCWFTSQVKDYTQLSTSCNQCCACLLWSGQSLRRQWTSQKDLPEVEINKETPFRTIKANHLDSLNKNFCGESRGYSCLAFLGRFRCLNFSHASNGRQRPAHSCN